VPFTNMTRSTQKAPSVSERHRKTSCVSGCYGLGGMAVVVVGYDRRSVSLSHGSQYMDRTLPCTRSAKSIFRG